MKLEAPLLAWLKGLGCPGHTLVLSVTGAASSSWAKQTISRNLFKKWECLSMQFLYREETGASVNIVYSQLLLCQYFRSHIGTIGKPK